MIRELTLKNFKSFTNSTFNFVGKNNNPKKIILLYGANGSGKTNFIEFFNFLYTTFQTLNTHQFLMSLLDDSPNFDSDMMSNIYGTYRIEEIIKLYKTIDSSTNMSINLSFSINGKIGEYYIEFDNHKIVHEKLEYTLSKNKGIYYDLSPKINRFNTTIFSVKALSELKDLYHKFSGKHTFMSLLFYLKNNYSADFFETEIGENMSELMFFFESIVYISENNKNSHTMTTKKTGLIPNFQKGKLDISEIKRLKATELIINYFFTNLYNDIDSVYYKTANHKSGITYELFFRKKISNSIIEVNYLSESNGTQRLLDLLPFFLSTSYNVVIAIDEFDNGIHDLLLLKLMEQIVPMIEGQLILTTHNTWFLNDYNLRDSIYIINCTSNGEKIVSAINDSDYRIQKSSNVRTNYMQGHFGGIPIINSDFDFSTLIHDTSNQIDE